MDRHYLSNYANQAKVRELESQLDQMVYKMCGLTPKEVGVIEGS